MFSYAVCVLLVSSAFAWPQQQAHQQVAPSAGLQDGPSILSQLPQNFQDKIPAHVKADLGTLTEKDVDVLKSVIHQLPTFTSIAQVHQTLKQQSPRLDSLIHKKALKGMGIVAKKRSELTPETRAAFHQAAEISKTYVKSIVALVRSQPEAVKHNLDTAFPHSSLVLNSPLFKQALEHIEHH